MSLGDNVQEHLEYLELKSVKEYKRAWRKMSSNCNANEAFVKAFLVLYCPATFLSSQRHALWEQNDFSA